MLQSSVGMSGGVFGLIGANVTDLVLNSSVMFDSTLLPGKLRSKCFVATTVIIEVAILFLVGLTPLVDNYAHLAGFFFGVLAALAVMTDIDYTFFGRKSFFTPFFRPLVQVSGREGEEKAII